MLCRPAAIRLSGLSSFFGTYSQIVRRKTRVHMSLITPFLPLYSSEAEPFLGNAAAEWMLEV